MSAPDIRWVDVTGAAAAKRHERWRRGVGEPVVRNFAAGDVPVLDDLMVVSWNVHVGSADVGRFLDDLRGGRLTGRRVEHFAFLVQETFRAGEAVPDPMPRDAASARAIRLPDSRGERHDAESVARREGLFVAYAPSMRNGPLANPVTGKCEDRGNAIFSTFPLTDITAVELPMLNQRRVAVLGHVKGRNSEGAEVDVQLGSIHFDLKATPWGRSAQARAIAEVADAPVSVLAGDLNILPYFERTLSIMQEAFPHSKLEDTSPTHMAAIKRRIDFQFCRLSDGWHAMPYARVPDLYNSDHYPLVGSVHFRGRGEGPAGKS